MPGLLLGQTAQPKEVPSKDSLLKDARENHEQLNSKAKPSPNQKLERQRKDSMPTMKADTGKHPMPDKKLKAPEPMPMKTFPDSSPRNK